MRLRHSHSLIGCFEVLDRRVVLASLAACHGKLQIRPGLLGQPGKGAHRGAVLLDLLRGGLFRVCRPFLQADRVDAVLLLKLVVFPAIDWEALVEEVLEGLSKVGLREEHQIIDVRQDDPKSSVGAGPAQ